MDDRQAQSEKAVAGSFENQSTEGRFASKTAMDTASSVGKSGQLCYAMLVGLTAVAKRKK